MGKISVDTKVDFQRQLERRIQKIEKGDSLRQFASQFFSQVPLAEVQTKTWEYVESVLLSAWSFYKSFDGNTPRVRAFNPTEKTHGYLHAQTIVEVASRNLPFLLDSIRIELSSRGIALVDVEQCMLNVVRASSSKIVINDGEHANESLIHLEVDRLANRKELEKSIQDVIRQVQRVVDDFGPMRKQLLLWSDEVGSGGDLSNPKTAEAYQYLQWMYANNFTFLGYEEFRRIDGQWQVVKGSPLGLARPRFYVSGQPFSGVKGIVNFSRSPLKSRVHRPAHFDQLLIQLPGNPDVACRFIGLFTSSVFNQSPTEIPLIRHKIEHIFEHLGLSPGSHKGRQLSRIIEVLPREELFLASTTDLTMMVERIYALQERRVVRVLARRDASGHFVSCLVYVPRDTYDTALRVRIQSLLEESFNALESDFSTFFSESALVRTHFVLRLDPASTSSVDVDELESVITEFTRNWEDDLRSVLITEKGVVRGEELFERIRGVLPAGYKEDYRPATAYRDLEQVFSLEDETSLRVSLYQSRVGDESEVRFKLFHRGDPLPLSDIIPILENLGARTLEEHPYEFWLDDGWVWIHDFVLELPLGPAQGIGALKGNFEEAFLEVWNGRKENDAFNRLVTLANIPVREVWILRSYARYLGQLQVGSSQQYIADCMRRYNGIARQFIQLFRLRFDPGINRKQAMEESLRLSEAILSEIERVENLADDRILRSFLEMVTATQRTNFFQPGQDGENKEYLSLKLLPEKISEVPLPRPKYEVFVYSSRVEGVHLRGGKIARGGLRWSDRTEDYRTEVLGLVKAQQVKNSVIVPLGAKGGFLPKRLPEGGSREDIMAEGIACYRIFIRGLLDLTDNLVKNRVVHPRSVVRHDEDDYYLVVAADKGTATFSDIANEEARGYGFWLDDAFASGGSNGYDHKQMGITARGAWKSVERHFLDKGIRADQDEFSVVGIGDMSGDVFGNGMLMSDKIRLVGAFNHLHIFVDPEPDAAAGFRERRRLFELPRSSWADYDASLISKGGGVFSRAAKSIAVSREMKKRFDITESSLTPNQLIRYLLKARVDLLWNGGIGTYVKSRTESDLDARDKSNDPIRVNGAELRCRVVGEGGNLGLTQLGRVEYNLAGGICFTDFIDNAGGVNCSDAEVNIKILLNQLMESGELTEKGREKQLHIMTDEVSSLVLENNYRQAQAINLMQHQAVRRNFEYVRVMEGLSERGYLDRSLEFLPDDEEIQQRLTRHQGLTSPELSVLTSYVKGALKESLSRVDFQDSYMTREMFTAFPERLVSKYGEALRGHRLRREIVATQIANNMINNMGVSFVSRIGETTGASRPQIAHAYIGARDIFSMEEHLDTLRSLDGKVPAETLKEMNMDLIRLVRRTTRWLLRNRRDKLDLGAEVPQYRKALAALMKDWESIVHGEALKDWQQATKLLVREGVDEQMAGFFAATHQLYALMSIVEVASLTGDSTSRVASVLFEVGERLHMHWFSRQMHEYQAASQWEALARESLQDDLNWQQAAIAMGVVNEGGGKSSIDSLLDRWLEKHDALVQRWMQMQAEIRASNTRDLSIYTVAIRELMDLAQSSLGTAARLGQASGRR